jgi:hypothetical protein
MHKQLFKTVLVSAALLLAICLAPVSALPASATGDEAGSTDQPLTLQTSNSQSPDSDSFLPAFLNEAQVGFLLACRCSPEKLPW